MTPTNNIKTDEVTEESWTGAFAAKSAEAFGEAFADDVVLEAAALLVPVKGRSDVKTVMSTASNYYQALQFTHEATNGPRTYVEWKATGASGVQFSGVTVLTRNDEGLIQHISISHRPLAALLEFSGEMNRRTQGKLESGHFRADD
ncbi:nuclear transport factor 2 family protein [Arthrobacter sp. S39]|uniref:nuclear transport factor 2 family protein n=1 Tax=Arthrobacter sp. S39 TaxID=2509720 RepID=UPI001037893F|nr:nuclear transport factor 2 family protein [Arthrobacter sp. S39]TAP45820.1 nuclear transport factor 2 family protein [Arthrobacter sp. S39]